MTKQNKRVWGRPPLVALIGGMFILTGCGANDTQAEGSTIEAEQEIAEHSAPNAGERAELIANFHDRHASECPFYKEDGSPAEAGDIAGSELVLLSCRLSPVENFGLAMLKENGTSAEEGAIFFTIGPNSDPGAFSPLWSLVGDLAGMNEAEEQALRAEMPERLRFVGNLRSIDYEPLMITESGVRVSFAGQKLQDGTGTLRVDPPS